MRKILKRLISGVICGLLIANCALTETNNVVAATINNVKNKQEIELSKLSNTEIKKILKENGLEYQKDRKYEKIVIEQPITAQEKKYKGLKYRIVMQYYSRPVESKTKNNFKKWGTVMNTGMNFLLCFAKPYISVPAVILGVDCTKWGEPGPKSYVSSTVYTHVTEKCYQFVTKGHKDGDWANYGICRKAKIENTVIAFKLINKKRDEYETVKNTKKTIRKTAHYDDKDYMLKKAYEYRKVSQPGYQEYL